MNIKKWIRDGHHGVSSHVEDTDELLDAAGRAMDKSYAQDIMGEIIFVGEDGKAYTGSVHFVVNEADPGYLDAVLDEEELAMLAEASTECVQAHPRNVAHGREPRGAEPRGAEPDDCYHCGSRNIAHLDCDEWECYDCGRIFSSSIHGSYGIAVKKMRDYTEKVWFLGTDALYCTDDTSAAEADCRLMDAGVCVRADEPESNRNPDLDDYPGAFYRPSPNEDYFLEQLRELKEAGYSHRFRSIFLEAHRRGYVWIYFHPDIETEDVEEVDEEKLTARELCDRHGGSGWDDYPEERYGRENWQAEVEANDTFLGYWDWVVNEIEQADDEE